MTMSLFPEDGQQETTKRVRPPFPWYGGKYYYSDSIVSQFPDHRVYVEPFLGSASVLLSKPRSEVEIVNDLDSRITNFFRVLRSKSQYEELMRLLELSPYSRETFAEVCEQPQPSDPVECAWWFFVRCRQARGGIGMSTNLAKNRWAVSSRTRRNMAEPVSKYLSAIDGLVDVVERFKTVMIESLDAVDVIEKYDANDVLFYCDPPYLAETRSKGEASTYKFEMTNQDHEKLLDKLNDLSGKVIISGYPSGLYSNKLKSWRIVEFETKAR